MIPAAILLDYDGTLADGERAWHFAHQQVAADLGGYMPDPVAASLVGVDLATSVATVRACAGRPATDSDIAGRLLRLVEAHYRDGVEWLPGAQAFLHHVAAHGVPMALVTSTARCLIRVALPPPERALFTAVVCGDDVVVGRGKPHPEPYLRAAAQLIVPPAACFAIEDSAPGAASARAAGATVLTVGPNPAPDGHVHRHGLVGLTLDTIDALVPAP